MKNYYLYIFTAFIIGTTFFSCERDDICVDTPITPLMTINFLNEDPNFELPRVVNNLEIRLLENDSSVFATPVSRDSLNIPLRTLSEETTYIFTRNVGDANSNNTASDTLQFTYNTENVFVNRACGFKTFYSNLSLIINPARATNSTEPNNWISRFEINNTNINDEPNTHIRLFH